MILQIWEDVKSLIRDSSIISILISLFLLSRAVGFLPFILPGAINYGTMCLTAMYVIYKSDSFDPCFLVLSVYLFVNILWNDPKPIFHPWERCAYFLLSLLAISSFAQSEYLRNFRKSILKVSLSICVLLSVLSFFCWFIGVNYMQREFVDLNKAGHFAGLFNHSMTLGPVAGISSVYLFYKSCKLNNYIYMLLSLFCVGAMLFSACRTAIVCTVIGIFVMIVTINIPRSQKIKIFSVVSIFLMLTFPIWKGYTELVISKQETNVSSGSMFMSRDNKWNARISEFSSNPILGIGFSSIDTQKDSMKKEGVVEPGSSWLAILSMTGIIGFIIIFSIIFNSVKICREKSKECSIYLSLIFFFCAFMITEGCVFAAGFYLGNILWLVLGCSFDYKYSCEFESEDVLIK